MQRFGGERSSLTVSARPLRAMRTMCAFLGLAPVGALVAWGCGLGPFSAWFWAFSAPAIAVLALIAVIVARRTRPWHDEVAHWIARGVIGGILGTLAYDVVRVPFQVVGLRLLTPIDSYGVLLLGAHTSSPLTGLAGWAYHFADGIGFGIAYAVVVRGGSWRWGLAWGAALESSSLVTPLAGLYGLSGKPGIIAVAYLGHFAYGTVLGKLVEARTSTLEATGGEFSLLSAALAVTAVIVGLVVWQRPWSNPAAQDLGGGEPSTVVTNARFSPQWLRIGVGHCVTLRNSDDVGYSLGGGGVPAMISARGVTRVCYARAGVHRVMLSARPFSGGFILVDPAMDRRAS